jgi:hypothetical protein
MEEAYWSKEPCNQQVTKPTYQFNTSIAQSLLDRNYLGKIIFQIILFPFTKKLLE